MSFAEDWGHDVDFDESLLCPETTVKTVWETREGVRIKIKDMATSHIKNCIKMLYRNIENGHDDIDMYSYIESFIQELENREFLIKMKTMSDEEFIKMINREKK